MAESSLQTYDARDTPAYADIMLGGKTGSDACTEA
jgi:hypothetical protein